jgi:hypothetical protein
MDAWVPTQKYWMKEAGWFIGATAETRREQRSLDALNRKGFITWDGQFTEAGLATYERKISRLRA